MTKNKDHILPGALLTSLTSTISGETSIAPVDAVLTSAGQSYTLSIKGGE